MLSGVQGDVDLASKGEVMAQRWEWVIKPDEDLPSGTGITTALMIDTKGWPAESEIDAMRKLYWVSTRIQWLCHQTIQVWNDHLEMVPYRFMWE